MAACCLSLQTGETRDALGARREQDNFVPTLMSRSGNFEARKESVAGDAARSKMIDQALDKLIFAPVF